MMFVSLSGPLLISSSDYDVFVGIISDDWFMEIWFHGLAIPNIYVFRGGEIMIYYLFPIKNIVSDFGNGYKIHAWFSFGFQDLIFKDFKA